MVGTTTIARSADGPRKITVKLEWRRRSTLASWISTRKRRKSWRSTAPSGSPPTVPIHAARPPSRLNAQAKFAIVPPGSRPTNAPMTFSSNAGRCRTRITWSIDAAETAIASMRRFSVVATTGAPGVDLRGQEHRNDACRLRSLLSLFRNHLHEHRRDHLHGAGAARPRFVPGADRSRARCASGGPGHHAAGLGYAGGQNGTDQAPAHAGLCRAGCRFDGLVGRARVRAAPARDVRRGGDAGGNSSACDGAGADAPRRRRSRIRGHSGVGVGRVFRGGGFGWGGRWGGGSPNG